VLAVPGRVYDATWGRMFAWGYDRFLAPAEDAGLKDLRRELLAKASGRCLEVGAGTGLNLGHWPETLDELVLTEPDPHMSAQLRKKLDRDARVVEAPAERLPFDDDYFDTVALTLVLCTVDDPEAALREIARVLRPDGRFLFLEHVRADEPGLARWQDRLHTPWKWFGDGCRCNRDTLRTIESSPLEVESADRGSIPKAFPLVRPMVRGYARAARARAQSSISG
jgi:ubiquinone/menaquinone biosynthesis C-methylase UbiE